MSEGIELRAVIEQLREELLALTETVGGEDLRFAVESVDVELHVGVTKEGKGGAKAKFWVLEVGAEGKVGVERTQTIKLTLKPRRKGAAAQQPASHGGEPSDASAQSGKGATVSLQAAHAGDQQDEVLIRRQ